MVAAHEDNRDTEALRSRGFDSCQHVDQQLAIYVDCLEYLSKTILASNCPYVITPHSVSCLLHPSTCAVMTGLGSMSVHTCIYT
jgi:Zn-dependent alcohol dehydrogenase